MVNNGRAGSSSTRAGGGAAHNGKTRKYPFTAGAAYDLILLRGRADDEGHPSTTLGDRALYSCSDALFWFGHALGALESDRHRHFTVTLLVLTLSGERLCFNVHNNKLKCHWNKDESSNRGSPQNDDSHDIEALQILADSLQPGQNPARYLLTDADQQLVSICEMNIFLWSSQDKVFVVDIDGTITTSTLGGFIATILHEDYSCCHRGVCKFLSSVPGNNLRIVYLTNRPITLANETRRFLTSVRQDDTGLPAGPIVGFTGTCAGVARMEWIDHSAHEMKCHTLRKYVVLPFAQVGALGVLWAGFGNTFMDMESYHRAGMDLHRMYIIDQQSRVYCLDVPKSGGDNDYRSALGTLFQRGYLDETLRDHVHSSCSL